MLNCISGRYSPTEGQIILRGQDVTKLKPNALRPVDFRGLGKLSKEPYKNLYRYLYGSTNSYEEAKLLKSNADLKGYTTSFIVAYKDGARISMKEAMKYVGD
jgi:N-acetylmuramoyl-L-alanine amidase